MDKVRVIENSIRYFKLSLWSLVPFAGIIGLVWGSILYGRIAREVGKDWNPAQAYVFWGRRLSGLGLLLFGVLVAGILVALLYGGTLWFYSPQATGCCGT